MLKPEVSKEIRTMRIHLNELRINIMYKINDAKLNAMMRFNKFEGKKYIKDLLVVCYYDPEYALDEITDVLIMLSRLSTLDNKVSLSNLTIIEDLINNSKNSIMYSYVKEIKSAIMRGTKIKRNAVNLKETVIWKNTVFAHKTSIKQLKTSINGMVQRMNIIKPNTGKTVISRMNNSIRTITEYGKTNNDIEELKNIVSKIIQSDPNFINAWLLPKIRKDVKFQKHGKARFLLEIFFDHIDWKHPATYAGLMMPLSVVMDHSKDLNKNYVDSDMTYWRNLSITCTNGNVQGVISKLHSINFI